MSAVFIDSWHTASGSGQVGKRVYYWDFSDMFGPTFTDKEGEPLEKQPMRGPAWTAFKIWHRDLLQERADLRPPLWFPGFPFDPVKS